MYEGKFAFKNRLGQLYLRKEIYRFSLFYFVFQGNFRAFNGQFFVLPVWEGAGGGGLYLEGLTHGGAYFPNFTVINFYQLFPIFKEKAQGMQFLQRTKVNIMHRHSKYRICLPSGGLSIQILVGAILYLNQNNNRI